MEVEAAELKRAIESMHDCKARLAQSVPVREGHGDVTVWDGGRRRGGLRILLGKGGQGNGPGTARRSLFQVEDRKRALEERGNLAQLGNRRCAPSSAGSSQAAIGPRQS